MAGTILGPGTIFLMLVGAFVAAFRIDNWTSFQYNVYPIIGFMVVCFTLKSNIQVRRCHGLRNWSNFALRIALRQETKKYPFNKIVLICLTFGSKDIRQI